MIYSRNLSKVISGSLFRQALIPNYCSQSRSISILCQFKEQKPTTSNVSFQQTRNIRRWKEKTMRLMYQRSKSFDKMPEKVMPRSAWVDWNYSAEVYAFAHRLGEPQLTEEGLTRAFMHRSYVSAQEAKQAELGITDVKLNLLDNSALIEQGKNIVEDYCHRYLRYFLRDAPEECIQSVTQYLLSTPVLSDISKWIGCIDMVFCSEFPPSEETLANTVLSVVAAIEEQSGRRKAESFIADFILTRLNGADILEIWPLHELGVDLNQYLVSKNQSPTEARILHQSAIGTIEACYVVGIYQDQKLIGKSPGESPEIAKIMAELDAFRNLFSLTVDKVRFFYGEKAQALDLTPFNKANPSLLP